MVSILLVIYKSKRKLLNSFIRRINGKFNLIIIDNSEITIFLKLHYQKKQKLLDQVIRVMVLHLIWVLNIVKQNMQLYQILM